MIYTNPRWSVFYDRAPSQPRITTTSSSKHHPIEPHQPQLTRKPHISFVRRTAHDAPTISPPIKHSRNFRNPSGNLAAPNPRSPRHQQPNSRQHRKAMGGTPPARAGRSMDGIERSHEGQLGGTYDPGEESWLVPFLAYPSAQAMFWGKKLIGMVMDSLLYRFR